LVNNFIIYLLASLHKTKKEKKGTRLKLDKNIKQCGKRKEEKKME
jgi:hypothetical protein